MSVITIQKSELVVLEASLKEKDKQIKQLQLDIGLLTGINHFNATLLLQALREGMATSRDMVALVPILPTDTERLKRQAEMVAVMDADIAAQQERLDLAISQVRAFCSDHVEIVRILIARFHIDLPALVKGGTNDV
jgi:hypothetical protein